MSGPLGHVCYRRLQHDHPVIFVTFPHTEPDVNESTRTRRHNPWLSVAIVCIAQLMVILDATIVNVALPSIQRGLDLSPANLQWVVNAYTLTFGGFLLLGGRMADLFGRRRLFFAG